MEIVLTEDWMRLLDVAYAEAILWLLYGVSGVVVYLRQNGPFFGTEQVQRSRQ